MTTNPTNPTNPTRMNYDIDPNETETGAFDDRNLTTDPDFEMDEDLAYTIGFGGRDPADDGGF